MAKLGNAWLPGLGAMGPFGWEGAKAALPKDSLAMAAWIFGHRYIKLNRLDDARIFFQTALDADGADSEIGKLAKAELDKLKGK